MEQEWEVEMTRTEGKAVMTEVDHLMGKSVEIGDNAWEMYKATILPYLHQSAGKFRVKGNCVPAPHHHCGGGLR